MPRRKDSGGWFKVYSSILDDPAIAEIGNEGLGVYIRILAMLNRARSADGKLTVSDSGLCALSGRRRIDVSEKTVRLLEEVGLSSLDRRGKVWEITVRKWPVYNGMGSNNHTPKGTHQDQDQDQDQNQHLISPAKSPLGTPDGAPLEGEKLELVSLSDDPPGGFDMLHAEPTEPTEPTEPDIVGPRWPLVGPHERPTRSNSTDIEAEVFAEVRRLAGTFYHDRKPRAWRLTKQRRARMRAIAKEFGPTAPVDSFQGFVSYHLLGNRWPEQRANLNPETVWRPSNVAKYLEQFSDGEAPGDVQAPQRAQNHGERISEFNRESAREAFRQMTGGAMDDLDSLIAIPGGKHDRR